MSGICCADVSIESFATTGALPPEALSILAASGSLFATRAWWDVVLAAALPPGSTPSLMACRAGGRVVAVIPLLRRRGIGGLRSLTTPYSCRYMPLLTADLANSDRIAVFSAFARCCRRHGVIRLDALPVEWDGLQDLMSSAHQAGLRPLQFDHFGNWYEDVAGLDWTGYLGRRPGALRQTIRRRLRSAARQPEARFDLLTAPTEMDIATEAFEAVYQRSWKDPEPCPSFNVALMCAMAELGLLRFAMWSIAGTAVAVQLWVIENSGRAILLKMAHDEAFKAHSPGTVLTALMLRHLLDQEKVTEIDFGRGDDDYKQGWAAQRRQRIGLLLVDPWRPSGVWQIVIHMLGRMRATMRSQGPGRLSRPAHGPTAVPEPRAILGSIPAGRISPGCNRIRQTR
jgi:CelD/BcsL family acetyltransferase involved in cellulose biosynthesis